jgi:hypothetical protein
LHIGAKMRQSSLQWASPTFIMPKKDITVQNITDFREPNKRIIRIPYQICKISIILQELEGFTNAMAIRGSCSRFAKISNPLFDPKKCLDMFNSLI